MVHLSLYWFYKSQSPIHVSIFPFINLHLYKVLAINLYSKVYFKRNIWIWFSFLLKMFEYCEYIVLTNLLFVLKANVFFFYCCKCSLFIGGNTGYIYIFKHLIAVCHADQFTCSNGECIDRSMVCNNFPDCSDEGDEQLPQCLGKWSRR